jgi:hypothetical protein
MDSKTKSALSHLTPIGWLIALIVNNIKRDSLTSFYLRQTLGIYLCFIMSWFIPEYYIFVWGFLFVLYTYSFIGTVKQSPIPIPLLGNLFQKWFKFIL